MNRSRTFETFVFTPAGLADPSLAICACRAGGIGVFNSELTANAAVVIHALDNLAGHAGRGYGLALDAFSDQLGDAIRASAARGLEWLIIDAGVLTDYRTLIPALRAAGVRVLAQVTSARQLSLGRLMELDGWIVKGNEAGGFVGEDSSFILLQKCRKQTDLPLYLRGGLTPHVAAACAAIGIAGGVLDSQLLLMDEVRLPESLSASIAKLGGSETVAVGNCETGEYFRVLVRPPLPAARQFAIDCDGLGESDLRPYVLGRATWPDPSRALLPVGQDVAFAAPWRKQYGSVAAVLRAIGEAVESHLRAARERDAISENAPLADSLGVRFPIIQGPMTRVSDTAGFARAVADGGALPMVALAVMNGRPLEQLLEKCSELLEKRPWGVGLLGFAPQELLDEQLAIAARFSPTYAIIAGGRPDQAVHLERSGVPSFLHVPSANLIPLFLQDGARRFIFEGRECGGHIGPLSSFVLWSSMIDRLAIELPLCKVRGEDIQVIFAGGIHDAVSCAVVQVMAAPLVTLGVRIGILMGSAYLFTKEIVTSGAIVEQFQREVLDCSHTVNLESGVGHASRCAYSPFARDFFQQRAALRQTDLPADERRRQLDELILGRLRIASKGLKRGGADGALEKLTDVEQHAEGMYMLGQVATLRDQVTDIETLHKDVTLGARALIEHCAASRIPRVAAETHSGPADIAIVGMACKLPQADSAREFWDNIVSKLDAITEIPAHRWDWRLYYDADRNARDKIYSKWGGFLDDLPFDPIAYGMPPKSIESVDPMQLMGLEIAHRTLVDSGYHSRPFDRERAAVIIGASGGIGDVGMQYGLRSELPRFSGELPTQVADRLPRWTEDSFAGILPNVAAGRIANRLNFGGMNITTDAACASSLAAIYQAVTELTACRSDFVIAGGLDTVQGPFGYLCFSKTQALSPRGKCFTFDVSGDGIAISEGIAMVALKRLADAQRDGDRIYCVIKGVGSSSDGNAKGLTAPLPAGQLRAMRRAYEMAGFNPSAVGLFEAHGTGTVAGDSAEIESTTRLIQEHSDRSRQAVIGSVKTMIGHTKATAGAAGLMKAALALHHHVLPPHNNVRQPIEGLSNPAAPLYLLDEAMPWIASDGQPRRAACSAFGFGGTNFHVVLEEYAGEYRAWRREAANNAWSAELLVWSSADPPSLLASVEAFLGRAEQLDGLLLRDIAASLASSREHRGHTLAIVARTVSDLKAKLGIAVARLRNEVSSLPPGIYLGGGVPLAGKLAVIFSGQGSQYPNMAREAALNFKPVNEALANADEILSTDFAARFGPGFPLTRFIFPRGSYAEQTQAESRQRLASTDIAQPALGAVEAGLHLLLCSLGLRADMFAGHSYGEFVALHAAGCYDFRLLMQLSAARGRFIIDAATATGAELGTMAAVNAPRALVEREIATIDGVILANHNSPLQSVISGTHAAIAAAVERLREIEVDVTEIPVAAAFHSSLVKPAQQSLRALIEATPWSKASVPVYSNTTGRPHSPDPLEVRRRMADHLVEPVEFVAEIDAMHADGARVFVEIGPKSVLTRLVPRILGDRPHVAISIDDGTGLAGLLGGIGQLLCAGVELDIGPLFAGRDCRIGELAQPQTLSRREAISKHAWMLNGSSARRAGDPVVQVGVTLEHAASTPRVAVSPAPDTTSQMPAIAAAALPRNISNSTRGLRRKDLPMDDDRSPSEKSALADYFATMRQFLETQERVMNAFLGGEGAARSTGRARLLSVNGGRAAELAAAPVITPGARPYVPVPAATRPPPKAAEPIVRVVAAANDPAAAPVVVSVPTPAPVVQVATPVKTNGAGLTRDKLVDVLLGIVEEKTGYPRDMLGLDQNLEADLGIDSIKRVEVVGAFLKHLPESYRDELTKSGAKLSTKSTLNGMLDLLPLAKASGAATGPFDSAGAGSATDIVSHPPRLLIRSHREPLTPSMGRHLTPGRFIITRDALGVAEELTARLAARGARSVIADVCCLASEALLLEFCQAHGGAPIAGIVHLAALGSAMLDPTQGPAEWRAALQTYEKSFFLLLRELGPCLVDGAHVVSASGLGGLFGRESSATGDLNLQGGAPGTLKSLLQERTGLRVKAVDLDISRSARQLSDELLGEIELDGGRQEVGYPSGQRTIFLTVPETAGAATASTGSLEKLVVLATGGSRGITAEVLRELARPGNTLILTGRSSLPEAEAVETADLDDANALRKHFVALVRTGAIKLTPADIQRSVNSILGIREMRANIADLRGGGATVEYHNVDVTDETALRKLISDVERRYGRIDGVVHGAGVIEDKLLAQKTSDSWSRVVDTKVMGLLLLQKLLNPAALKFFTVFSSVAGRYGNSGQSDYATANELMNRLCVALQARWPKVAVRALCWGPWGATKFGSGMVTAETEAKFETRGVFLVGASMGRKLFKDEIAQVPGGAVEIICGQGPWEDEETRRGVIRAAPHSGQKSVPMLAGVVSMTEAAGRKILSVQLDSSQHARLGNGSHNGTVSLSPAAAIEVLAQAANLIWPHWRLAEIRELRVLKSLELAETPREVRIHVNPPPYGSSAGFDVTASIHTEAATGLQTHFQCVLGLQLTLPAAGARTRGSHTDRLLPVSKAHGELFIEGLSASGASASVRSTTPAEWLATSDIESRWLFDPGLLDAAAQMVCLWTRSYLGEPVVPACYGRVVRHSELSPGRLQMEFTRTESPGPKFVRGDVVFFDEAGEAVLTIEDLDCTLCDIGNGALLKHATSEGALA